MTLNEATTPGLRKALSKGRHRVLCANEACGFPMPVYPGRYPKHCPLCNTPREAVDESDAKTAIDEADAPKKMICPRCKEPLGKLLTSQQCQSGKQYNPDRPYFHRDCFNKHRETCNACGMLSGKAGR